MIIFSRISQLFFKTLIAMGLLWAIWLGLAGISDHLPPKERAVLFPWTVGNVIFVALGAFALIALIVFAYSGARRRAVSRPLWVSAGVIGMLSFLYFWGIGVWLVISSL